VTLDQERIVQVARDDTCLILQYVLQAVDDIDATTARRTSRLNDPIIIAKGSVP